MILDQVEAGKRLCPVLSQNQVLTESCRASACMAWRWVPEGDGPARRGFCGLCREPAESKTAQIVAMLSDPALFKAIKVAVLRVNKA